MKTQAVGAVTLLVLGLGGCSDDDESSQAAAPSPTAGAATGEVTTEAEPAAAVVQQYYDALVTRDCTTMRTLSALSAQQDDEYWADGCIEELQESLGDDPSAIVDYAVLDGTVDGQESVFHVERPLPDGTPLTETVVLIAVSGAWAVESRTPATP